MTYFLPSEDDLYDWPFIVTHPKPAVALVGQNLTLSCNAVYVPNPFLSQRMTRMTGLL